MFSIWPFPIRSRSVPFRSNSIMQLAHSEKHSQLFLGIHTSWPVLTLVRVVQRFDARNNAIVLLWRRSSGP
jgi:hypothetical protein